MSRATEKAEMAGGLAIIGGLIAGFAGLVAAVFAIINYNWVGAGVCLAAAGISFGLVASAVWRR